MDNKKIASQLLFMARELIGMDFPTQDAFDKYMKEHPDANRSNHRVVKTPDAVSVKKEEPVKKYDFSPESYFKSNPKHKDAVDSAKEELKKFKETWQKQEDFEKERDSIVADLRAEMDKAKKDRGLKLDQYKDLPQDVQDDFEAKWEKVNKKYFQKGETEFDTKVKEHRKNLDKIFEDAGVEGINSKYSKLTPDEYEEKMGSIHKNHHLKRIGEAIKNSQKINKTDAVKSGDFVAISRNGTLIIKVDKVTPSGQINSTNVFDGTSRRYSKKQWEALFDNKDLTTVSKDLADEAAEYVKNELKKS